MVAAMAFQASAQQGEVGLHNDVNGPHVLSQVSTDGGQTWTEGYKYTGGLNMHVNADTATGDGITLVNLNGPAGQHGMPLPNDRYVTVPVFCLEVSQEVVANAEVWAPHTVTGLGAGAITGTDGQPQAFTQKQIDDLNKLWANAYDPAMWDAQNEYGHFYYGAFQACIWEIINEDPTNDYNINSGSFQMRPWEEDSYNSLFDEIANGWLASLSIWTVSEFDPNLVALRNAEHQDLLATLGYKQIPEPLTMTGLGLALMGAGAYLRNRKKAKN